MLFILLYNTDIFHFIVVLSMEKILVLKYLVTSSFCHFMFTIQTALGC